VQGFYEVYERNQTHFQIGDNNNLFEWTYVGNVAYAHILAADKLSPPYGEKEEWTSDTLTFEEQDTLHYHLPPVTLTTGFHRVPTSEARPLGPYITRPPNAEKIETAFNEPYIKMVTESSPPVIRSRFDQFSDVALKRSKGSSLDVAGQVFFITNGEPVYFWDFTRTMYRHFDLAREKAGFPQRKERSRITFPRSVAMVIAGLAEWGGGLVGRKVAMTKFRVQFSCVNRSFNIEKARRVLGYEPQVGLEEGIKRMFEVCG
jgi:sterol-4alpha-carboxylate 3-dehydrogenase (decarboxylating)